MAHPVTEFQRVVQVDVDGNPIGDSGLGSGGTSVTLLTNASATGSWVAWPGGDADIEWEGNADGATIQLQKDALGNGTGKDYEGASAVDQDTGGWIVSLPACNIRITISGAGGSTSISAVARRV